MLRAVTLALLFAASLLPGAAAATAEGTFTLEGTMTLPPTTLVHGGPYAAFVGEIKTPLALQNLEIRGTDVRVTVYWINYTTVGAASIAGDRGEISFPLPDFRLTASRYLDAGYFGLELDPDATSSTLAFSSSGAVRSNDETRWSYGERVGDTTNPYTHPGYQRAFTVPHVVANAAGTFEAVGPGKAKLFGMILELESSVNRTTWRTGDFQAPLRPETQGIDAPVQRHVKQWMVIESNDLSIHVHSSRPWSLAYPTSTLEWTGEAWFRTLAGSLRTPKGEYAAELDVTRIDGSFHGGVVPTRQDERVVTTLTVSGDLQSSSLTPASTGLSIPKLSGSPMALILGLVLGAALGSTAGVFFLWRRRSEVPVGPVVRAAPPQEPSVNALPNLSPEYFVTLAEQYIQAEDHARALHWITLASEAMPTSSIVASTRAYVLGEMGQYDEALVEYEKASRLDPVDGEADINAARLAAMAGKPPEVVESFVLRALERTPEFVLDVEEDESFKHLAKRPAFRKAVGRAWDRWGGSGGDEGLQPR